MLAPWKESYGQSRKHIKKQRHYFASKDLYGQSYGFSNSYVRMWELDHKEGWTQKNWCSWTVVLEKTLESPLNCKEIQPVHSKGGQPWVFIGRTDVEVLVVLQLDCSRGWYVRPPKRNICWPWISYLCSSGLGCYNCTYHRMVWRW